MSKNKKQESLTNVIAEGRGYKGFPVPYAPARAIWLDDFNSFLERIEAAYKRDIEKLNSVIQGTVSRSDAEIDRLRREAEELRKQIGNAAKLREALVGLIDGICFHCDMSEDCKGVPCEKMQKAKAALAAPARNCDVGTAKEQLLKFKSQCFNHHTGRCSRNCKFAGCKSKVECALTWAQMPYESEVSHGNA